jgi:hypothetical protein
VNNKKEVEQEMTDTKTARHGEPGRGNHTNHEPDYHDPEALYTDLPILFRHFLVVIVVIALMLQEPHRDEKKGPEKSPSQRREHHTPRSRRQGDHNVCFYYRQEKLYYFSAPWIFLNLNSQRVRVKKKNAGFDTGSDRGIVLDESSEHGAGAGGRDHYERYDTGIVS